MPETPLEDRSEALLVLATGCKVMRLEPRHYEALRDLLGHAPATVPIEPVLAICAECQARNRLIAECRLSLQLTARTVRRALVDRTPVRVGLNIMHDSEALLLSLDSLIERLDTSGALSNSTGRSLQHDPPEGQ